MAGRDGFVDILVSIPVELRWLAETYQKDMKIVSFSGAVRRLLESHPEIDIRAQRLYAGVDKKATGEELSL